MLKPKLFLRLFAEVADADAAAAVAELVKARMLSFGTLCRSKVERYWKIPEDFEVFIELDLTVDSNVAFQSLMAAFASGWQVHCAGQPEQWAIWNPSADAAFFLPEVRWANLECYLEPSSASQR